MKEVPRITLTRAEKFGAYVDAAISVIAPGWALRRLQARTTTKMLGSYRGAEKNRLRGDWKALNGSADADLLPDLPTLRQRSRDLNRNDAHASGITGTVVENVVGTGLRPQSRPDMDELELSPEQSDLFTKKSERAWKRWCPQADAQNRMTFYEIQSLVKRQILENGDVFVIPLMIQDEPWRHYRLALEVIEADRCETPIGMTGKPNLRDGVELGDRGQPIAYHIRKRHPGDVMLGQAGVTGQQEWIRYPAFNAAGRPNVLHLFHVKRPGQTRGEPFFAPVMTRFKDLSDGIEAEIVAMRVAACFAAFVTKTDPYGALTSNTTTNANAQKLESIEPGMIEYLNVGETISFGDPKRPAGSLAPFVEAVLRSIGSALNLPLELVLKDFSKTNYSSARAALLEARRFFRGSQTWLAERLCQPCWEWVLEEAWLKQELPPVDLMGEARADWMTAHWIAPGWGWVDPVKEVESSKLAIESGLSTLADECASQGRNWEDVMRQRKREQELMDELGLTPPAANTPGQPGQPGEPGDEEEPDDDEAPANPVEQIVEDYVGDRP